MKYKFHDNPPDFEQITEDYYELDTRSFHKEISWIASYLNIKQSRIRICDHPCGEDVIFIDDKYNGYVDFDLYTFMDTGLDMYGSFEGWKDKFK